MPQLSEISVPVSLVASTGSPEAAVRQLRGLSANHHIRILRSSIDARQRQQVFKFSIAVYQPGETVEPRFSPREFHTIRQDRRVIIVGAGPAGLFAALRLLQSGICPVVVERGKNVRERRRDLVSIHREHRVNPDSNYCFGEGGAGTYSDGKLYTRSTKRGDVRSILETLVQFGADERILVESHPHIGTNKLPALIAAMRDCILEHGGEVHFNARVTDILIEQDKASGVLLASGEQLRGEAVILATGHSARDIFYLLHQKGISIQAKPFALGVRAEHPQALIDQIQYKCDIRPDVLPAAAYSLVEQVEGRGVYSFCMCPGGIIAPCATSQEEIVTNGWSPSKRNNPWANSGIVVPVDMADAAAFRAHGELALLSFQASVEHHCWDIAGRTQTAPAQRMVDFVEGRQSHSLPSCSYQPGVVPIRLDLELPGFITHSLKAAFKAFGKKMKGYYSEEAILVGPESRTSSPVRIPRDAENLQHPYLRGLYPCGEGAGYAGGIVSAAMDGERVAAAILMTIA